MKTLKTNPSRIDLDRFGQYMAKLDLQAIPPHKRQAALMDHLLAIQEYSIEDREIAAQINLSRKLMANDKNRA